jgi:inhibitor of cysteine peptidase
LTEKDQGKTVELEQGGVLEITLPGNATTGYTWGILSNNGDVLQQAGDWTYQPESDREGAPGTFTIRFQGLADGTSTLKLGYKQWWDDAMKSDPTFDVTVNVSGGPAAGRQTNLTDKDNGQTITLVKGDTLVLSLPCNPGSTGYVWRVMEINDGVLKQQGMYQFKAGEAAIGAPGTCVFTFQALDAGSSSLKLGYKRWWDEGMKPEQTFEVTVNVNALGATAPLYIKITDQDQGKTVEIGEGGALEIDLPGNATTGYTWGVLSNDTAVLKPVGDVEYQPDASQPEPGAPGVFTLKFEAASVGTVPLKLGYKRWWDMTIKPDPTFEVTVRVMPKPATLVTKLSQSENGKTVVLNEGYVLEVALDCNPSTAGYSWQVMQVNAAVLVQEGEGEYEPSAGAERSGAPGTCIFRFRAVGSGVSTLKLGYKQWWDAGMNPDPIFEVTVNVK